MVLAALGTCLAAAGGWRYARASAPVNGPIVLISIDGLRADHIPAYGYRQVQTPAIDALAADGLVFERAYSHVPQTLPAHAALLTGRLPFETGVRGAAGFTVNAAERLLPEMLGDRGYATAGIVSSVLLRKETGIDQGFSFFDADMPESTDGRLMLSRDGSDSERMAERWLDSVGTSRAFLFLHIAEPHTPQHGPARRAELPSTYDASIARADEVVGRLVRYLKTHQLYDRSTIILVSDHGEGLGDHGERGHGLFVYENTLRVPLIVKQTAEEGAGRRIRAVVRHVDLVPTILDLAKAPIPGSIRGRSLTPILDGDDSLADVPVYAESLYARYHFGWSELTSVIDGRYHYIKAPREELYDLETDPREKDNLAGAEPEIVARLRKTLAAFSGASTEVEVAPVEAGERTQLEASGYVGVTRGASAPGIEPVDPKDGWQFVEQYRSAARLAAARDWSGAADAFRALARQAPKMQDVWMRLASNASRANRLEVAIDAYGRAIELEPNDLDAHLGLAADLLRMRKIEETRQHARHVLESTQADSHQTAIAHELLARVALLRRDLRLARAEAALAEEASAERPVRAYIEGRIAFDQKRYADALTSFEAALARLTKTSGNSPADLRLYAAEAMLRVDRLSEAEELFVEVLRETPQSTRARAGLSALQRAKTRAGRTADSRD